MWGINRKHCTALLGVVVAICATIGFVIYKRSKAPITLYGNVDIRAVTLGFRVSGRIKELNFDEGDRVKKGDVLAILEQEQFEKEVSLHKAEVSEAEATLSKVTLLYERRKALLKNGAVSQGEFDDASASYKELEAQLARAQARLEQVQMQLEDTELKSPDSGIILTRVREAGSVVAAGAPIYTLSLTNPVWIRAYIDEPNLENIYPGQKALVFTDGKGEYEGKIGFISPQSEFTPKNVETVQLRTSLVYRVRIIANDPSGRLRQGMPVTIKIEKEPEHAVGTSSGN
jgi:HlyD family secretion protein